MQEDDLEFAVQRLSEENVALKADVFSLLKDKRARLETGSSLTAIETCVNNLVEIVERKDSLSAVVKEAKMILMQIKEKYSKIEGLNIEACSMEVVHCKEKIEDAHKNMHIINGLHTSLKGLQDKLLQSETLLLNSKKSSTDQIQRLTESSNQTDTELASAQERIKCLMSQNASQASQIRHLEFTLQKCADIKRVTNVKLEAMHHLLETTDKSIPAELLDFEVLIKSQRDDRAVISEQEQKIRRLEEDLQQEKEKSLGLEQAVSNVQEECAQTAVKLAGSVQRFLDLSDEMCALKLAHVNVKRDLECFIAENKELRLSNIQLRDKMYLKITKLLRKFFRNKFSISSEETTSSKLELLLLDLLGSLKSLGHAHTLSYLKLQHMSRNYYSYMTRLRREYTSLISRFTTFWKELKTPEPMLRSLLLENASLRSRIDDLESRTQYYLTISPEFVSSYNSKTSQTSSANSTPPKEEDKGFLWKLDKLMVNKSNLMKSMSLSVSKSKLMISIPSTTDRSCATSPKLIDIVEEVARKRVRRIDVASKSVCKSVQTSNTEVLGVEKEREISRAKEANYELKLNKLRRLYDDVRFHVEKKAELVVQQRLKCANLANEVSALSEALKNTKNLLISAKSELRNKNELIQHQKKKESTHIADKSDLQQTIDQLHDTSNKAKENTKANDRKLAALERYHVQKKSIELTKAERDMLNTQLCAERARSQKLNTRISSLQNAAKVLQDTITNLNEQMLTTTSTLTALQTRLTNATMKHLFLTHKLHKCVEKCSSLTQCLQNLSKTCLKCFDALIQTSENREDVILNHPSLKVATDVLLFSSVDLSSVFNPNTNYICFCTNINLNRLFSSIENDMILLPQVLKDIVEEFVTDKAG